MARRRDECCHSRRQIIPCNSDRTSIRRKTNDPRTSSRRACARTPFPAERNIENVPVIMGIAATSGGKSEYADNRRASRAISRDKGERRFIIDLSARGLDRFATRGRCTRYDEEDRPRQRVRRKMRRARGSNEAEETVA